MNGFIYTMALIGAVLLVIGIVLWILGFGIYAVAPGVVLLVIAGLFTNDKDK